ncbi:hypothetical protein V1478_004053 [Vespula squamosa]|uniref:Uncharacterized protein n=1 Tax=Vespula squamosa TaxID=30214 RepID=A0ABD2BNW2_VESSQ
MKNISFGEKSTFRTSTSLKVVEKSLTSKMQRGISKGISQAIKVTAALAINVATDENLYFGNFREAYEEISGNS